MSTTRYNKYVPLFGPSDDRRPRILINIAEDQYLRSLKTGDVSVVPSTVPKEIDSAYYKKSYGVPNGTISAEFVKFLMESTEYIRLNEAFVVDLIKSFAGISKDNLHNTVTQLIITVMKPVNFANHPVVSAADLATTEHIKPDFTDFVSKIKDKFPEAVLGPDAAKIVASVPNQLRDFSYQYDTHFISSLLEEACSAAESVPESTEFFGDDDEEVISREYRPEGDKACAPTRLVIEGKDGHMGAYDHLRKNMDKNCATTGVTDDGAETCQGYLRDCLQGRNIKECARYMKNPNFWANASNEVRNMNPLMIVKTLEAFNFDNYVGSDGLKRVVNPNEWLRNETTLNNDEKKAIGSNVNLMGYLSMLVARTNRNPAILNPSTNVKGYMPYQSRANKMGIPPLRVPHGFNKELNNWINASRAQTYRVGALFGVPTMFNGLTGVLAGGAYTNNLDEFTKRSSDNYVGTGEMFAKHVEALNYRLHNLGKQIHQGDLTKINQLIDSLKNSERKLNKTMLYAEKYARLLEVHGIKDNSAHVLSMDHLKEFVDQRNKYFDRVNKRQTDLYSILTSIANAVSDKANNVKTLVKNNYSGLL